MRIGGRHLGGGPPHRGEPAARRRHAHHCYQRRNSLLRGSMAIKGVTIVDHPLVQHKLTLMPGRRTPRSRASANSFGRSAGWSARGHPRPAAGGGGDRDAGAGDVGASNWPGKEAGVRPDAALRHGDAGWDAGPGSGPRVAHVGLYRDPRDAGMRGVLLQSAGRPRRAPGDSHRSDAGHRQHRHSRRRPAERGRRAARVRMACLLAASPEGISKLQGHHPGHPHLDDRRG